ncbi:restriction endonuclease subunit S, partial [Actinomycetota bacterium]
MGSLELPAPSPETQAAIADFLDRKTERIDRLMEKKRRLIELLEERFRVARIEMTRRGLDTDVDLVDSGLPFLGRV